MPWEHRDTGENSAWTQSQGLKGGVHKAKEGRHALPATPTSQATRGTKTPAGTTSLVSDFAPPELGRKKSVSSHPVWGALLWQMEEINADEWARGHGLMEKNADQENRRKWWNVKPCKTFLFETQTQSTSRRPWGKTKQKSRDLDS